MAFVVSDRVREVTTVTGTGPATPSGAFTGFTTFSDAIGAGNTTFYVITNAAAGEWEVGAGTFDGTELSRDTIFTSSNNDLIVNFAAGTKEIFCDLPAKRAVYNNVDGSLVYDPAGSAIIYAIALGG
jgi:hypothetical protein